MADILDNAPETDDQKLSVRSTRDEVLTDEELLKVAKMRFSLAAESESETRKEELEDEKFMVGEQWPIDIKSQRLLDLRPCLTINRLPQFVRQITNDQRQNRPSIKVNPVDDEATVETGKVYQGMIRHIEYASHADIAYDTAFEAAAKSGLGYFRIITDYSDPMSFQQEIKIKMIKDRFAVYFDPYSQEPDGSDANWAFIFEEMSKEEFCTQYPDARLTNINDWDSESYKHDSWVKKDSIRVSEYYYKSYESEEIVLLNNGKSICKDELPTKLADGLKIISERTTMIPKVNWCKMNGDEILEKTEILGEWIPVIPVIGEEEIVQGKRLFSGVIRHAKDPQRMYNYWASAETEAIALAPKAPFVGYAGQFEGYEEQWKTANTKNHAFLEVNNISLNGQPAPLPQRNVQEPPVQAITQARTMCIDDMKGTTGIYDASLGNRSNEQSGVAIQRRNAQAQTGNFHYIDNLSRSLRHAGRVIVNWIPQVYDTAQAVRCIGEDGEVEMVLINQIFQESGKDVSHFLDAGQYDVTISTGPSYQTKRQEAVGSMLDLARSMPQTMQVGMDLLVRNMDWPGAQEIADRIKKTLPPNIVADDKDQIPASAQAQMAHMNQMIQTLTTQNQEYIDKINSKILEIQSKERISAQEQKTQIAIELMKHDQKDAALVFQAEQDHIDRRLDLLNIDQPITSNPQQPEMQPGQQYGQQMGQPGMQQPNMQQTGPNPAANGAPQ